MKIAYKGRLKIKLLLLAIVALQKMFEIKSIQQ